MSGRNLFRCDYCGMLTEISKAEVVGAPVHELDNGDVLCVPACYCSAFCGRKGAEADDEARLGS